ncbi:MAG: hypothetical protein KDA22_12395 [Phycisphaerales bacterium]|nr:hypothetical protein [Phycisphaerales bacterium]
MTRSTRFAGALAAAAIGWMLPTESAWSDDLVPPPYRGAPLSVFAEWEFAQPPANPNFIPPDSFFDVAMPGFVPDGVPPHAELGVDPWVWVPGDGDGGLTAAGGPGSVFGIAFKLPNFLPPDDDLELRVQVTYQWPAGGDPGIMMTAESVERLFDKPPGPNTLVGFPGFVIGILPVDNSHYAVDWILSPSWHFTDVVLIVPFGVTLDEIVIDTVLDVSPPENDACADALPIAEGNTYFSTLGASDSEPPLPSECDEGFGTGLIRDIWFAYKPTCSGTALITACNPDTNYDARLAVYTGTCDELSLLACNDDLPNCPVLDLPGYDLLPTVEIDVQCDTTYYIRLGGYPGPVSTGSGDGTLTIVCLGGHPCLPHCDGDLNGDGTVDGADLGLLLGAWGPCLEDCPADLNHDDEVDGADLGLLLGLWGDCPILCPASDHGCFEIGPPGCTDIACCDLVCSLQPICCEVMWDGACVGEALAQCLGCGSPFAGDCCTVHANAYCDDLLCCEIVCQMEPFCCLVAWDVQCVATAEMVPECGCLEPFCPPSDHDCFTIGEAGCTDVECCVMVCAVDPFCCDAQWDLLCVAEATDLCGPSGVNGR